MALALLSGFFDYADLYPPLRFAISSQIFAITVWSRLVWSRNNLETERESSLFANLLI
jgi:hypothetical protein